MALSNNLFLRLSIQTILLVSVGTFINCKQNKSTLKAGIPATDFRLETVTGKSFVLTEIQGNKVLLHFWADWCTECRAEFPEMQKAHLLQKESDLKIIAINVGQTHEHVQSFVDYYDITFPMLMDPDMEIAQKYKIHGLPASVLINSDFTIFKSHLGWLDEQLILEMKENMK